MSQFLDLPVEILPLILDHLLKPHHLALACLISTTFRTFAVPRLYEQISIYSWHKGGKFKVLQLFSTLAFCPCLAKHVRGLEIRDFPKAFLGSGGGVPDLVVKGIHNCSDLRSCTWTRDGSLSSEILGALCSSPHLRELEFNGRNQGNYDPQILSRFRDLTKISVIMPSNTVVSQIHSMLRVSGHKLRHLTFICKSSPVLTDRILESVAPLLINLEQLHLTGCPKVTERGVSAILDASQVGLTTLSLEAVSPKFGGPFPNMADFAQHCVNKQSLRLLRSITLTIYVSSSDIQSWTKAVLLLLSCSPLERFQIYATSPSSNVSITAPDSTLISVPMSQFWSDLINVCGDRLLRFSVHRMLIGLPSIHEICTRCPKLEELFIVVEPRSLDLLPRSLSQAKNLRVVHINYPLDIQADSNDEDEDDPRPIISPAETLALVRRSGPSLSQFGCNTRVWQVGRDIRLDEDGELVSELKLLPYENPNIPEQFLVVRT